MTGKNSVVWRVGLVCCLVAGVARGQSVLDQVPADALVVVRVKSLQDLSAKVTALANVFGLDMLVPELADPLGTLQTKTHVKDGLNAKGDLAIVMLDKPADRKEPAVVVLVPVSDFGAFMGNWANAQADGAVTTFTTPQAGRTMFAASWGSYAAISDYKPAVAQPAARLKVGGVCGREMAARDVAAYINMGVLGKKGLDVIAAHRAQIAAAGELLLTQVRGDGSDVNTNRGLIDGYMALMEQMAPSVQGIVLGMDLDRGGITGSAVVEFDPASAMGQAASAMKNTDAGLLAGLPAQSYLIFGGARTDPAVGLKLLDDLTTPVVEAVVKNGGDPATINQIIKSIKACAAPGPMTSAFGTLAPQEGSTGFALRNIGIYGGDAKAIMAAQTRMMAMEGDLATAMSRSSPMNLSVTRTAAAKTVDGVVFDDFQIDMNAKSGAGAAGGPSQMLRFFTGSQGTHLLMGAVDDAHLLDVNGLDDDIISSAIAAVKANSDEMDARADVAAAASRLPKMRIGVAYVSLDTAAQVAARYARMLGISVPVRMPPDMPPVGFTLSSDGSAIRVDCFTSAQTIKGLISAVLEVTMHRGQGMQSGGGL